MSARSTIRQGSVLILTVLLTLGLTVVGPAPTASAAVKTCSASTPAASRPLLRQGDSGSCVAVLQQLLQAHGYSLTADGQFGPITNTAVRRYQSSKLDLTVDGVVGPASWNRLVNGGGTPYDVYRGPNTTSRVTLTFDDCPTSLAAFRATVSAARNQGIALALLPTGNCLTSGRFDAAFARSNGHYVFNHSISHPDLTTLSSASVLSQLGAPGVVTTFGRPPYGAVNNTVRNAYANKGIRIWLWNVDTNDWQGKSRAQVVSYVIANAKPGQSVLMHMQWNAFNGDALAAIASGLSGRGIGVCRNQGATPASPRTMNC